MADEFLHQTLAAVDSDVAAAGFQTMAKTESPIRGGKGNREWLYLLRPVAERD